MKRTYTLLAVVAVALAACGGDAAVDSRTPDDPDAPVLTVTSEGGFVPVEMNLDQTPRYVLTADRSLYFQGPMTLEFPGPLLPNIQVSTLGEDEYEEILDLVEEIGLPGIDEQLDDSGQGQIADASTDFITFHDENGDHRYGFYALGIEDGGSTDRLLAAEIIQILDQAAASAEARPYEPDSLRVIAGPPVQNDPQFVDVQEWPLDISFADMEESIMGWRCTEVTGEAVAGLLDVFSSATQATVWDTGEEEVSIRARPLLPGETACQSPPEAG